MFLDYTTARGKQYALIPSQVRALEGDSEHTRIYASVAGVPITFTVRRPFDEVRKEWQQAAAEQDVSA